MSLKRTALPLSKEKVLDVQIKHNSDLGRDIEWRLVSVKLDKIMLNAFNNRFSPDEALTKEEHENAIIQEDAVAFENLEKSIACNPQTEPLVGYTVDGEDLIRLIMGHRRYFALERTGNDSALAWLAHGLTEDEVEQIRDWPEIHQTKVAHSKFAQHKAVYLDLKDRTEIDRAKRINVWKQKGYSRSQILKSERVFGRIEAFCAEEGEKPADRITQVKSFETYDSICETTFAKLKDEGDIGKVVILDQVAKAFLKNEIAHDDLKVTVDGLADLPPSDPAIKAINSDPEFLSDIANLRRLTILARTNKSSSSVLQDVEDFTARILSKLVQRADVNEMSDCLAALRDTAKSLEANLNSIKAGGI